ncbi:hypothetical protein CesoFtcFv8_024597 [Champsocephalus esox]|uniref:CCHC-type domain-containing protein n=1 Tax=Champsocephalus esox TaxID=159716 RepID=A0AAN8GIH3_9TELE|nr:hypothetical protein CesoFtcFv8_024597 [Champsocephalus esox]
MFLSGLSDSVRDLLVPLDLPPDLDSMIALAIRTDTRLQERRREKARKAPPPARSPLRPGFRTHNSSTTVKPASGNTEEEPMQLGRARLSPEEKAAAPPERLCFYCGKQGHFLGACPLKDGAHQ